MIKTICELCGKEANLKAIVEGAELNVCSGCARYGKVLKKPFIEPKYKKIIIDEPEKTEMIVSNYAEIIRKKREEIKLKQEDFAKKIKEKESLIQKIERGEIKPSLQLAKKIEKEFNIKLTEFYAKEKKENKKTEKETITIGDMIVIKKRKTKS